MSGSKNSMDSTVIIKKLQAITPLKFLNDEDIRGMLRSSKMIRYEPGEVIFQEGDHGEWIYFLITGNVAIKKKGELISELKRRGDLFGEMGLIDNSPRSASIIAIDQTVCLAIDASYTKKLKGYEKTSFNAIIYRIFAEVLVERLRLMDVEMVKIKTENNDLRNKLSLYED